MKLRLIGFALLLAASASLADVQVTLNNRVAGEVIAPITRPDGSGAGAGVTAQLILVNGDGTLMPLTPTTTFRTTMPTAAYFVKPITVTIPGIQPNEKVTLRLRAWEGKDFETSFLRGESKDFQLTGSGLASNLIGLKGFQLVEQKKAKP